MGVVYLGLGSNVGDRFAYLKDGLRRLGSKVDLTAVSLVYETEPEGYLDQPKFLNAVCEGRTALDPLPLLDFLTGIEKDMGRQVSFRNSPRPMDLDILFYDDMVVDTPRLSVPHPRLAERAFVLVPLLQIAPELRHPLLNQTIRSLVWNLGDKEGVALMEGLKLGPIP